MADFKKGALALATAVVLALPSVVNAQATYTYTGNQFDDLSGPYTSANFVSGSFTIGSVLTDGTTSFTDSTPSFSYSFSDGLNVFDNTSGLLDFQIKVVSGAIADWSISLFNTQPSSPWLMSWLDTCTALFCGVFIERAAVSDGGIDPFGAANRTLGTWTMISAPPVPEPETYAMLLVGLGLLGFAARRRKLKEETT